MQFLRVYFLSLTNKSDSDPIGTVAPLASEHWTTSDDHCPSVLFTEDRYHVRFAHSLVNPVEVLVRDPAPGRKEPRANNDRQEQDGTEPESAAGESHAGIVPPRAPARTCFQPLQNMGRLVADDLFPRLPEARIMAPSRLVRFGVILGVLVVCGATVSATREDEKAELNNAKARLEAARYVFRARIDQLKVQGSPPDAEKLYVWSRRWMDAEREVSSKKQDQIAAVEAHLGRMKDMEKMFRQLQEAAMVAPYSAAEAKFYRLEAEKHLSDARKK